MEIFSNFHHILALASHWNVTASCQDTKPALSQLMYAKTNKQNKTPLFKSPLVPTVLLGKSSAGLPWRGAREVRPWAVFPTCSRPLWRPPAPPCLSARPHSRAAVGGPDPSQGTEARSSRNSSAWLMWEQRTHCGKPSWVSAAMRGCLCTHRPGDSGRPQQSQ